jgi:hypothetical protein
MAETAKNVFLSCRGGPRDGDRVPVSATAHHVDLERWIVGANDDPRPAPERAFAHYHVEDDPLSPGQRALIYVEV